MGWLDRMKRSLSTGAGIVGTTPSAQFSSPLELVHAALTRFESSRVRNGGWVSFRIRDTFANQLGIIQYAGDGLVNLCDRDDIDPGALLRSAGREDLAARCEERDSAMYAVADATVEDITLLIDLVLAAAFGAPTGVLIEAEIESG